jgi:hypothetical protein
MGQYLDIVERVVRERAGRQPASYDRNDINDQRPYDRNDQSPQRSDFGRFGRTLGALERRCPAHIDFADWEQAVGDGRVFVAKWGHQAEALGWTPNDVFGLHSVPDKPAANYRRLSRCDETGLIWLLRGRPVVALTETTAAIQGATAVLTYRKLNKPALGPVGDSLHDMERPQ